ncbi:MAG: nitrite reductase large subunit NirB [Mycobacteriales bacterium]
MNRKTLVVVGHGMVGHRVVETAVERGLTAEWDVVVHAEEDVHAYDRVALSTWFEGAELGLSPVDDPRVELRLADPVVSLDTEARTVTSASGLVTPYDALVLATGSTPFVPPVDGSSGPGRYVYRTIEDLEAIKAAAATARRGVVIGGGLLGLEAANAPKTLGVETTVVEFAPRLMPVQVDAGGGEALRRLVEGLGVSVKLNASTKLIADVPGGLRLSFAEGEDLDTDIVVFSAGIRPVDGLAREAGLEVGERGGVTVDHGCLTSVPDVYAVGECASALGRCWGLVAPGYAMAEVVIDRLLGGTGTFEGADLSTKLKCLGIDVASFGDAFAEEEGAVELVWADPIEGVYRKLVVSDDAKRLLGGILVGDASAYASLRPLVGSNLTLNPADLIAPSSSGAQLELPDEAQVCSCYAVTKGEICEAAQHTPDVASVKECTKAGTGCGSCLNLVKSLVNKEAAAQGIAVSNALCEHFALSRAELFETIRVKGVRSWSQLIREHGTGKGCDICKPAAASILASLGNGYILDGEQGTLQDTNDHMLANLQKDGSYSVVPRMPGGECTPEQLIVIGQVAKDFGLYTKITGGQRIDLFGARVDQLPAIWQRLVDAGMESGHAYGKALRTVKSCVGSTWCRYGVQDSTSLAVLLELRYRGLRAPHKIKLAVSGCARECAEARSKDVGIIATENGWNLYVGGNGGFTPRHADLFLTDVDTETLVRAIDRFLMFYVFTGERLQRTAPWVEATGLEHIRSVIMDDSLGLCGDLDAAMDKHVATYSDEWADTLNDPERLARFVHFVNAPDVVDPSIRRVPERGQPRPVDLAGPTLQVVKA